jgi:hypothetical protein
MKAPTKKKIDCFRLNCETKDYDFMQRIEEFSNLKQARDFFEQTVRVDFYVQYADSRCKLWKD